MVRPEHQALAADRCTPPRLEARGVTRVLYDPLPVVLVQDVDFEVAPGEFVAITGPSGSGKSSLLYLLGLLDRPSEGEIYLEGQATRELDDRTCARLRLEKLGFIFQFHFLLQEFDVLNNIMLPMRKLGRMPSEDIRARAEHLLTELGLASELRKTPDQLSGGQRQRVAVARALANDPTVILADEPTGNLDTKNAALVFDLLRELAQSQDRSVVAVTHDANLAANADRRVVIVDGRIAEE